MIYDVITIFPQFFESPFSFGILKKAHEKNLIRISTHDPRKFALDKHNTVDDKPYGGGAGMVFKPEPVARTIESLIKKGSKSITILTTPQGEVFSDNIAKNLSKYDQIILICGRYEGIDERIREIYVDKEISIGDYVLSGGEYAAAVIIDAVSRFIPNVLGNEYSPYSDSFGEGLLEHPQYTRPETFNGKKVPEMLLTGNHKEIESWRRLESLKRTLLRKPYLLDKTNLNLDEIKYVGQLRNQIYRSRKVYVALVHYPVYNKSLKTITTAFTNLDVHDISRVCRTYGIKGFYLVQPVVEQQKLVERVLSHWITGPGRSFNPTRAEALKLVSVKDSIDDTLREIESNEGIRPKVVVTDARAQEGMIGYHDLREKISTGEEPYLILFGTGWGIVKEVIESADYILKPIESFSDYNHLSVRSAAAAIIDRLLSC